MFILVLIALTSLKVLGFYFENLALSEIIANTGASSIKDMGKVMAELKALYAGQVDMGKASALIKTLLG